MSENGLLQVGQVVLALANVAYFKLGDDGPDATVEVRFNNGQELAFEGEDAEQLQEWLVRNTDAVRPLVPAFFPS